MKTTIQSTVRKVISKETGHQPGEGTVFAVDGNRIDVKTASSLVIRNVPVVGDISGLVPGQMVSMKWVGARPTAISVPDVGNGSGNVGFSVDLVADNDTLESSPFGIRVKKSGIRPEHLAFEPSLVGHTHKGLMENAGWNVDTDGTLYSKEVYIHPEGQISLGASPNVIKLDASHATHRMWVGGVTPNNAPFSITKAGAISATSGTVGGWTLGVNQFTAVDNDAFINSVIPAIGLGAATDYMVGAGFWVGYNTAITSAYKLHIGNPTGDNLHFDGNNLTVTGYLSGIILAAGTNAHTWTINQTLDDTISSLIFGRTTGGSASMRWNGTVVALDKPMTVTGTITGTQLTANIANGTAPLVITSATMVANLNADTVDGMHGVGTAQYQFLMSGASPYTGAWTLVSTLAGSGLTHTTGVLAAGAGTGITVNADDVAVNQAFTFAWTNHHTWGDGKQISSSSFASGWAGNGWRVDNNLGEANKATAEFDTLTVRGRMRVYELLINQIRATNGSIFVSSTGKVKSITITADAITFEDITALTYEDGTAATFEAIYAIETDDMHGFLEGDLIRAQRFNGTRGVYRSDLLVTSVVDTTHFVAALLTGSDAPDVGYGYVRLGSASDLTRRGSVYMTADDSNAPYIDIVDGVNSHSAWNSAGVIKARLGKLSGITDPKFGVLSGYGIWTGNGYFTGSLNATAGFIGGVTIAANKIYTGTGTWGNTDTGFYLDETGKLSLRDKLKWDGSALSITGTIAATAGYFGTGSGVVAVENGGLAVGTSGAIRGGQTAYNTGTGFFMGYNPTTSKWVFSVGNPAGNYLFFDGTNLAINGSTTLVGTLPWSSITNDGNAPTNNATVGATWGTNLNSIPTTLGAPAGSGLFLSSTNMGYYAASAWKTYIDSSGNMILGDIAGGNTGLSWNQNTGVLSIKGVITITAGGNAATTTEVGTAQSTANTGVSNAATAQSTANTGVSNAATAQSTANTGVSNAATAQSTANTGVSNAATAQSTASTALGVANAALPAGSSAINANHVFGTATASASTAGLYLGSDYMGYWNGSTWKTYIAKTGDFYFAGSSGSNYIQWDASANVLQGVGGGTIQWYASATDGRLYAGGGSVVLDAIGLSMLESGGKASINWYVIAGGFNSALIRAITIGTSPNRASSISIEAYREGAGVSNVTIGDGSGTITLHGNTTIPHGLNVGSASGAGTGDIYGSGNIHMAGTTAISGNGTYSSFGHSAYYDGSYHGGGTIFISSVTTAWIQNIVNTQQTTWATIGSTAGWSGGSSRELKTNVEEMTMKSMNSVRDELFATSLYSYQRKDVPGVDEIGFIAEEAPAWVHGDMNKKSINATRAIGFLSVVCKAQEIAIRDIETRLSKLE